MARHCGSRAAAPGAWTFLSAAAVLFASFIGFDSIAQAGGEAKNPGRNLPLAIGLAVGSVGLFYMLFTAAVCARCHGGTSRTRRCGGT